VSSSSARKVLIWGLGLAQSDTWKIELFEQNSEVVMLAVVMAYNAAVSPDLSMILLSFI